MREARESWQARRSQNNEKGGVGELLKVSRYPPTRGSQTTTELYASQIRTKLSTFHKSYYLVYIILVYNILIGLAPFNATIPTKARYPINSLKIDQ